MNLKLNILMFQQVDKRSEEPKIKRSGRKKVLETAVFLDSAAYRKFSSYFSSIGGTLHSVVCSVN